MATAPKSSGAREGLTTVDIQDRGQFLVRRIPVAHIQVKPSFQRAEHMDSETSFIPATIIDCNQTDPDSKWLLSTVNDFLQDPEYSKDFLRVVVFKCCVGSTFGRDIHDLLQSWNCDLSYELSGSDRLELPEGPCFFRSCSLFQQWKLCDDEYDAFNLAMLPSHENITSYTSFGLTNSRGHLKIAVPSRLHYKRSASKPLNGLRVGVKDIFDIEGVETSGSSRAWEKLYGKSKKTAPSIQALIDLGVVVVGKTKGTQFASGEQPTADWIEYSCPWNPRGDGYLNPRGSSTGSGVAVAGYEWLDFAVGSDTSGSMRGPASVMGTFANRPTYGLLNLEGMIRCARSLDTAAFATRDVNMFHDINLAWYKPSATPPGDKNLRPTRLLYLEDYLPYENPAGQQLMDLFVSRMASFLEIKVDRVNLQDIWAEDDPTGNGTLLKDYVKTTMNTLIRVGYYKELASFREEYKTTFGALPYLSPVIRFNCEQGEKVTLEEFEAAEKEKAVYKNWMHEKILQTQEQEFNTILMYPCGDPVPAYRDNYRLSPDQLGGYDWRDKEDHQACLASAPAIVIPIGQTPYLSRNSGNQEWLPVAIAIMAAENCDHHLTRLAKDMLTATGLDIVVKTGKMLQAEILSE